MLPIFVWCKRASQPAQENQLFCSGKRQVSISIDLMLVKDMGAFNIWALTHLFIQLLKTTSNPSVYA